MQQQEAAKFVITTEHAHDGSLSLCQELPRKTQTLSPQLPTWAWHSWSRSELISFTASWSPTWIHSMQEALWDESQKSLIYEYRMQFRSAGVYWSCKIDNFNVVEPKLQKCACHSSCTTWWTVPAFQEKWAEAGRSKECVWIFRWEIQQLVGSCGPSRQLSCWKSLWRVQGAQMRYDFI